MTSFQSSLDSVDNVMRPYLWDFIDLAAAHGFNFSEDEVEMHVGLVPQIQGFNDEHTIAICYLYVNEKPLIMVDPTAWEEGDDSDREAMVFHELGHCLLHRGHTEDRAYLAGTYVRTSVMNHLVPLHQEYKMFKEYFREELFDLSQIPYDILLTRYVPTDLEGDCNYLDACSE